MASGHRTDPLWRMAEAEIEQIRVQLPVEVQAAAAAVPVVLRSLPDPEMVAEDPDLSMDLLGLFVGESHDAEGLTAQPLPGQIFLFLDNLIEEAAGDPVVFREEVVTTYLHELGHYLGWDEEDLDMRGLS